MNKDTYRLFAILFFISAALCPAHASHASEVFYTIQAGTYLQDTVGYAERQFDLLSRKLDEDVRVFLRIETEGKYCVIRLGKFEDKGKAEKALKSVKNLVSDAFILKKTDFDNAKVLMSYHKPSESGVSPAGKKQLPDETAPVQTVPAVPAKQAPVNEKELLNRLIEDVSVHFSNQEYGKASEILRKGLEKWPDDPNLHAWYGATLLDAGFPDRALEEYRKAADLLPDAPEFHAGIGHSLLSSYVDRAKNSVAAFKKALELDPDNVSALEGLGIVYVSIGKKYLATEIYRRLVGIDKEAAARLNQYILWGLDWGEVK